MQSKADPSPCVCPIYCSCHKLALIASNSHTNTWDLRVFLQPPCWQNVVSKQGGFGSGGYMPVITLSCIMMFNMGRRCPSHLRHTHVHTRAHSRLLLRCLPCLLLVSFLLSLFIRIKIRLWPDILLIGVVSCWRTSDLDEISHPVKSDSRQCTND